MAEQNRDLARVYDRLDQMGRDFSSGLDGIRKELSIVKTTVTKFEATCKVCHPVVLGSGGRNSIDKRVATLETVSRIRSKGTWILIGAVVTMLSGVVLAGGAAVAGKMWGN